MRICVYAAASDDIDGTYIENTEHLGKQLANCGHSLVYGGGSTGLMGAIARGFRKGNGEVVGVTPKFMDSIEPIFEDCTSMIITETMADRKEIMEDKAEAFIIAPGGIGTFDEFFQCLTLKELGRHKKPVIIYNFNNYYSELLNYIDNCIKQGFIKERVKEYYKVVETTEGVIQYLTLIAKSPPPQNP